MYMFVDALHIGSVGTSIVIVKVFNLNPLRVVETEVVVIVGELSINEKNVCLIVGELSIKERDACLSCTLQTLLSVVPLFLVL